MNKEELLKEIMKLPKIETNNPICTMNSITVDDLMSAIDRLKKVPEYNDLLKENKRLKDKLSKIETLIINHNCDTGDIYYKYNSKFLKSELKQRILEILYEESDIK